MSDPPEAPPQVWHLPLAGRHSGASVRRVLLGRQGIFSANRDLLGFELLFRAPGRLGLRIDLWNSWQQDRATEHVLAAAFFGGDDVSEGLPLFVNFTRSYLLDPGRYLRPSNEIVLEVVESAYADVSLFNRLADLKALGYRIALDDFQGSLSQLRLLELADYVKVDYRDLSSRGSRLVEAARSPGSVLVAERIETRDAMAECEDLGFGYFQGHWFEAALVLEREALAVRTLQH